MPVDHLSSTDWDVLKITCAGVQDSWKTEFQNVLWTGMAPVWPSRRMSSVVYKVIRRD